MPLASGSIELVALGDFQAGNESAEVLPIDVEQGDAERGKPLKFPLDTRAVEARLEAGLERFVGYGERREQGRFDVLLWPELRTCSVFRPDGDQGYPGKGGGQALGYSKKHGVLLAAGGNDPLVSDSVVGALSFDVRTGAVVSFDTLQDMLLREGRAFATVSELGDKLVIAGGQDPAFDLDELELELRSSAELFDPVTGTLGSEPIQLRAARTHHAAVTLRDGSTLLLGGRGRAGATTLAAELISAESLQTKPTVLPGPRLDPQAFLLSDGRVFLGGGTTNVGEPTYPAGEWISADGLQLLGETDIPARFERAFVATAGGGVLAVGGCESREPESDDDASECARECVRGCRPLQLDGTRAYDAFWLDPDGNSHPVTLGAIVAPRPILLPGSDGQPWLVAELESEPGEARLFRFDPWGQVFESVETPSDLRLPRRGYAQPVATDPDAFVWLDDDDRHGELWGLRLGTRNRYAQDLALVLLSDPDDPTRPLHLVPDRPLAEGESYDGKLWLGPREGGGAGVTVTVADADYTDVSVSLRLAQASAARDIPESAPPLVLLGDALLGGDDCPWPSAARGEDTTQLRVLRRGALVELSRGSETTSCSVPEGRRTLGLRANAAVSVIEQLDIARGATAF